MKYQQIRKTSGAWAKSSELADCNSAKIVSETESQPSMFKDKEGNVKNQDVCKVMFEGKNESLNVSLNRATINGLIQAFGEESIEWQNKPLKVETEKMRIGGRAVIAMYLIPEGFKRIDDDNGYAVIIKDDGIAQPTAETKKDDIPVIQDGDDINVKDIPF